MNATLEQVTPEVAQALVAQAVSQGLSVNDYLRGLLSMSNGATVADTQSVALPPRNEAMFAALQRSAERLKEVPVSDSTERTLQIIREGRAGAMYGGEPTEAETAPTALSEAPQTQAAQHSPRNEEMLAIIRRSRERMKDMPVRGSMEETLLMIRKARAGEMWGYEPTDYE